MAVVTSSRAAGVDWRHTLAFIDTSGTEIERARLRGLLGCARPDAKAVLTLEARQNLDGGFPHDLMQGRPSTIRATATALAWLEDLSLRGGPLVERALTFLLALQRPDGSWDEPPGVLRYGPPPPQIPGDPRVRVLSTALAAYWLARARYRGDALSRAVAYLRDHQVSDGRFVGFLRTTWLGTALFRMVEGEGSPSAARSLESLAAVDPGRWHAGALAGMLSALAVAGVPQDVPLIARGLARLHSLARPDGSWLSEDGDASSVETTLRALRALLLYGAVSPRPEQTGEPTGEAHA
jgi:Prenyltransferase and squalene oxidase repeat